MCTVNAKIVLPFPVVLASGPPLLSRRSNNAREQIVEVLPLVGWKQKYGRRGKKIRRTLPEFLVGVLSKRVFVRRCGGC